MNSLRLLSFAFSLSVASVAHSATIAVVAPQSGPYEILGSQIRQGVKAAAAKVGLDVMEIHESCEDGSGGAIADGLVASKVSVVVGFLCTETLADALPTLKGAAIPAITLSSRAPIVMEDSLKRGWPLFRMAASETAESSAIADVMLRDWKGLPFALLDDGTIYSRELVDRVRARLEEAGLKPTFTDTLRPSQEQQISLVRRLSRTGVTHVFAAAERNDVSIIARDATAEKISLVMLGGDALRAANTPVPLQPGVLAMALPDYATLPSANEAVQQLRTAHIEPDGYVLPAYAATQLSAQALEMAAEQSKPTPAIMIGNTFTTVIGPITFTDRHELQDNPYRLQRWTGTEFTPVDKAIN